MSKTIGEVSPTLAARKNHRALNRIDSLRALAGARSCALPIDFSRAEMNWVPDLITRVADEGHMDALALVDTFGVLAPHSVPYLVREAKKRINKRLEAHFHMDFEMGVGQYDHRAG